MTARDAGRALGGRLLEAREARRLTQDDVARVLGVTRVMVSHWERGQRNPSEHVLERLAGLYGTTLQALLEGGRPAITTDLAELLYRDADGDVDAQARAGLEDFVRFLEVYADLLERFDDNFRPLRQSPFRLHRRFTSREDIRRKAMEVRSHLRLGFAPIGDLSAILDSLGITIYRASLGSVPQRSVSGAFLNHPRLGMSIVVNVESTLGRQKFTVAHELAHALYHSESGNRVVSRWGRDDERERFADQWAGEFLVPLEGLRDAAESLGAKLIADPEHAVYLQRYFRVSYAMMLTRLRQARLMEPAAAPLLESAQPLVIASRLGYRVSAEEWRRRPGRGGLARFPRRFVRLLTQAVRLGRMSVASAAGLTGLTVDEISELVTPAGERADPDVQEELGQFRDVRDRIAL